MKVRVTFKANKEYRAAVYAYYESGPGLATHADLKRWFSMYGTSMDDDLGELVLGPLYDPVDGKEDPVKASQKEKP